MNLSQNYDLIWPKLREFNTSVIGNDGGTGVWEKVLAMFVLGVGSFISGMLPAFISERSSRRFPLTTSLMLCFGAGILLATSIIHILPEVRKQINSNWAEISLCGGFFFIYFIDEFIHYFFGEAIQHSHSHHGESTTNNGVAPSSCQYGSIQTNESQPLLNDETTHHGAHSHAGHAHCTDDVIEDANARICHTSHTEPCAQSMTGTMGLFAALSLHSALEGMGIGVQDSPTKVLFLLGAVACHKFVMGFCLGLEFRTNASTTLKSQIIGILVFALGAVAGIGLGMLLVNMSTSLLPVSALAIIQGLAGGTLLYVTVCEVIPREKARWHQNPTRKAAGFAQFLTVAMGFATMAVINYYLDDDV
ncbi:zinc/iron regulated transporter-related protein 88E [Musca autumnalis]|uniref:zinc/iron regulated transporter-related protein 88E n=1 Tax=Musca autumnalis TaxID=221902 RepID=UPI003CF8D245